MAPAIHPFPQLSARSRSVIGRRLISSSWQTGGTGSLACAKRTAELPVPRSIWSVLIAVLEMFEARLL